MLLIIYIWLRKNVSGRKITKVFLITALEWETLQVLLGGIIAQDEQEIIVAKQKNYVHIDDVSWALKRNGIFFIKR